jgi:uncharacterized protein (DUF1015 family)
MAIVKPFAALRPKPELADKICELPYDVMSSDEARAVAAGNPLSFLHISKPEIDLPRETDLYAAEVYTKGRENFQKFIQDGTLRQEAQPCFYLYRQIMGAHTQTGLVAVASCEDYQRGIIRKHEQTRVDKEDDRVRHIETLNTQSSPVFLTYPALRALDELIARQASGQPEVDFTAKDGVRHTAWTIWEPQDIQFIETQFARIPFLYIADGHHRSAAAARVFRSRRGAGHSGQFLAVIFPHDQMQILPYNRVLKDLNGLTPDQLLKKLESIFTIAPSSNGSPARKQEMVLFFGGNKWFKLTFRPEFTATNYAAEILDVTLLQQNVLAPILGIDDPRTSKRIQFVGGIRGTAELEKLVNSGEYACAFSMFPVSIQTLMAISDAGGVMPPKSTWFEPKLRDGMFCHLI